MSLLRTKTIRYAFATSTSDLATNTTLGTATRLDFSAITVTIPETSSRTFLSVIALFTWRDRFTVADEITAVRTGSKVGAAAYVDVDRTFTQANTGDHLFDAWSLDITDNFNTNFGAGSTQTVQCGLAVAMTTAANIGGSITCELIITYQYDDSVGTTRVKTIGIPIQSHHTTLTTTQQEVGTTGGTTNAPANQIPALDTYLPEASKTYKQIYLSSRANDASAAVTDITPFIQIDSAAEVARGLIGQALQTAMPWKDIFDITGSITTNAAHAFKMRADVTGRMVFAGSILWVTYTYDTSSTTTIINQGMIPFTESSMDTLGIVAGESFNTTDGQMLVAAFDIEEPGSITLLQSAFVGNINSTSTATTVGFSAGGQAERSYTPISVGGEEPLVHRGDHSSGWTIARGPNRLLIKLRNPASAAARSTTFGYLLLTYTSGVPSTGAESGKHAVAFFNATYNASVPVANDIAASGGGQRTPTLVAPYAIDAVMIEGYARLSGLSYPPQLLLEQRTGELDATGFIATDKLITTQGEIGSWWFMMPFTKSFNRDSLHTGKMAIETGRREVTWSNGANHMASWWTWITYHQVTFTCLGLVNVAGSPAPNGKTVKIYAVDANGVADFVTSTTTTGGLFTVEVPDNVRTYFASYVDGTNIGRSADGTPGSSNFNITIGGAGETVPPTANVTPPGSVDYAIAKDSPVVIVVQDASSAVGLVSISVKFANSDKSEFIYGGNGNVTGFAQGYQTSTISGSGAAGVGYTFNVRRDGSWPKGTNASFKVIATDALGNILQ